MKKTLFTIGLASLAVLSSHAQGYVVFSSSTQNMSTNNAGVAALGATASGKTLGVGNYYYALFSSSTITTGAALSGNVSGYAFNTSGWTFDADPTAVAASTATAGRFLPTAPNGDGTTTVPGLTGGNSYNFVVVGWSANLGTTLAAAQAALSTAGVSGFIGQSAVSGPIATGNGGSLPASAVFGGIAPAIQAFTLGSFSNVAVIPEPTTLALAGLGGASLLLFRRRK
jgi:hypothetical protein